MVDWPKLFAALARVRFTGPISLPVDYQPKDELAAIRHDIDFIRKQVAAAYALESADRRDRRRVWPWR